MVLHSIQQQIEKKFNNSNWGDQICQQIDVIHLIAKSITTLQYVFAKTFHEGQKKTVIIKLSSCNAHIPRYLYQLRICQSIQLILKLKLTVKIESKIHKLAFT